MLSEGGEKETFTIQTPEKLGGPYLPVGSPRGLGLGYQGTARSTFIGRYKTVFNEHAGGLR